MHGAEGVHVAPAQALPPRAQYAAMQHLGLLVPRQHHQTLRQQKLRRQRGRRGRPCLGQQRAQDLLRLGRLPRQHAQLRQSLLHGQGGRVSVAQLRGVVVGQLEEHSPGALPLGVRALGAQQLQHGRQAQASGPGGAVGRPEHRLSASQRLQNERSGKVSEGDAETDACTVCMYVCITNR